MTDDGTPHTESVRVPVIPQSEWTEEILAAMSVLPPIMQPQPGQVINALGVLANHPALAEAHLRFSLYFRFDSTLPGRARELLILRTAWLRGALYELSRHARNATREGITPEEIARVADGSEASGWDAGDRLLLRAAEELCADHRVGDGTWAALGETRSLPEMMDIVFLVGAYDMLAMAFNTFGTEPEDDIPPFPGRLPPRLSR